MAIRWFFPLQNGPKYLNHSFINCAIRWGFLFKNNPKKLDLSYKTDPDSRVVLERKNFLSYNVKNIILKSCLYLSSFFVTFFATSFYLCL